MRIPRHQEKAGDPSTHDAWKAGQIAALLDELRRDGIQDERVLGAIAAVPRDQFVPDAAREHAWSNVALPIGDGQTISQPLIVAIMTSALELHPDHRVLEIGAGSGYQAAILARLAAEVCSVERHAALADRAVRTLERLGITNVRIVVGDGTQGWPEPAVFDRIIVTAAGPDLIPELLVQLRPGGGRLVMPVGPLDDDQRLVLIERTGDSTHRHDLGPVRFVPLIGQHGWAAEGDSPDQSDPSGH